jgi:putative tryptophan/tyrosine transport system substrate-binding protein
LRTEQDLHAAFEEATRLHLDAMIIGADGLIETHKRAIISLAEAHRIPAIHPSRDFVEIGGLIAYAVNYPDLYFRAASHVDKILKGVKAGDIPVEQPTRLELVINLRTAKALGLIVPQMLLARADEVIE